MVRTAVGRDNVKTKVLTDSELTAAVLDSRQDRSSGTAAPTPQLPSRESRSERGRDVAYREFRFLVVARLLSFRECDVVRC